MASTTVKPPKTPPPSGGGPKKPTGIARAALIMVTATLLSRVIGMVRDMVIAYQFGQSANTDAYVAAFKLPDLMTYLIAGGALSSTFIPVFSEYLHNKNERGAWKTFSVVATVTALVAAVFVVVVEIYAPTFVVLMNAGYRGHPAQIALAAHLARIVLPAQIFFMLGGLLMGTLNARGQFLIPSLGPSIYNLGIIFGALVLAPLGLGLSGLMWGALIGAFIGNFALQLISVTRLGARYRPSLDVFSPGAVKVWKMMLPILLGVSLPNVDQIINSYFASELPYGAQTAMQFANRVMLIPIGIFAQAMAIAIFPTMAAQAAAKLRREFKITANRGLRTILFLTVPSSALFFALSVPIIALLFQHGKFHAQDTLLTAVPLRYYAIGIFAWSAQAILTRGFYAIQDSRTPVISGTIMTVLFIGMNWFVIHHTGWGVGGLALATTIAAILHMAVMYIILRRRLHGLLDRRLALTTAGIVIASACLFLAARGADTLLTWRVVGATASTGGAFLHTTVAGLCGIVVYLAVARALHMPELEDALGMLRRRKRG